jgi:hypothetical protein
MLGIVGPWGETPDRGPWIRQDTARERPAAGVGARFVEVFVELLYRSGQK